MTTRIGVIGLGAIAVEHLGAYQKNPLADLVAVCDVDVERAKARAEQFAVPKVTGDVAELLSDPDVDAVSVCVPNTLHAPIAEAALRAGKDVLVEKPMTVTVAEAERLVRAVEETGKALQVGYVRRFAPNALVAKRFLDAGEFGDVYAARATLLRAAGNPGGWFGDVELSGGGPLIDLGVHIIDLCWYLMGMPKAVSASGATFSPLGARDNIQNLSRYRAQSAARPNTVEDYATAQIRFENGAVLNVDTSFSLHGRNEIGVRIHGDKGGAEIEPELLMVTERHDTLLHVQPQIDSLGFDFKVGFANQIDHFLRICRGEIPADATAEQGLEMARILTAIYESAERGAEVAITR
ncbi:Gfo/Idh/MocA family protein [Phytomonospora endophytica]|uniref:Putative dehydrogenase n=1 Tax=Phytomonospora endophytica TaxID=714109 RepID=A0A841FMG7_9ACTN|nr:Gfo/Idh/MocA family oxidoreductase [Phytomonospora endophytica]MBB6037326.1 putative dehydrogenase [Phytomonospora endophytica]GIG69930.1 oxidoreductase [Phytomonospora endophytica]